MVATNEYTEFRTETDDEFEEMDFDGCEYEVPSNTFIDLNMNAVDDIQEHDPIIVPMVTDNTKLYMGMICENQEMLQHMVKCFAIKSHAPYEVVEPTPTKWVIRCKKSNEELSQSHVQLDSSMLAREFFESVREKPSISVASLESMIKEKFGYHVSYRRAWDGKKKAVAKMVQATPIEGHVILSSVFWAFGPCIEAFNRCRPFIQIDGTHLYGKYRGKLLIATSIDSNGHLLPSAFAVIEEESADSWGWFLRHLKQIVTHDEVCLVFDRHAGIISVVNNPDNGWI
ncbi:uncharacterized protein E6C27_scaffold88G001190 [Cucumis melo var. makuwa]|uniref:MULE transposase domain-containing protein n=1 Tax=Cucumis melo var. makuwa TaxID=1194695 RepID=A0A5A7UA20_CUCMM|nr:uncharacterized protein E6C27_scaffold88G001190 [Cucumis melo var. makuwa]